MKRDGESVCGTCSYSSEEKVGTMARLDDLVYLMLQCSLCIRMFTLSLSLCVCLSLSHTFVHMQIVSHKSNAVELVQKCAPDVFSLSTVKDRLLASIQQE